MKTFADIVIKGNAAGAPLVADWPQMRGALYILGHAAGGLDQVHISDFELRFPEDFEALDQATQEALPNEGVYRFARKQVCRLLSVLGEVDDPWEHLRMLIRRAGRDEIENGWYSLRRAAIDAGLAPSDICTCWVWSLEAEAAGGIRRQTLRRGVAVFNELFRIPSVQESLLLPSAPIGPPPIYDRRGRRIFELPPTLSRYQANTAKPQNCLQQVWQAIRVSGIANQSDDPTADDLLSPDTWELIKRFPEKITGFRASTWNQYLLRTRKVLLPYATIPIQEHLPARFEAMIVQHAERRPIETLWRLVCARNLTDAEPDDLIQLTTWRELWSKVPHNIAPLSWRRYEARARRVLVLHATHRSDPYRVVVRAWRDLGRKEKASLAPIRKLAEIALLRPLDITTDWVASHDLEPDQETQIINTLRQVFFAASVQPDKTPEPDPVIENWKILRAEAQARGFSTVGLNKVATQAIEDGMIPQNLTPAWAAATAARMSTSTRAKFAHTLRKLDDLKRIPDMSELLYAEPISVLPDARKKGKIDPPKAILRELDILHEAYDRAPSTCRDGRALVRKFWTVAVTNGVEANTLERLLQADPVKSELDPASQKKADRLLKDLHGMKCIPAT